MLPIDHGFYGMPHLTNAINGITSSFNLQITQIKKQIHDLTQRLQASQKQNKELRKQVADLSWRNTHFFLPSSLQLLPLQRYPSHNPWSGGKQYKTGINFGSGAQKQLQLAEEQLMKLCQIKLNNKQFSLEFKMMGRQYCKSLNKWKQTFQRLGLQQANNAAIYQNPNHQIYQQGNAGKGGNHPEFLDKRHVNWAFKQSQHAKDLINWIDERLGYFKDMQNRLKSQKLI